MTIYARTALGTAAVSNNNTDFPRKLRTLLIAVDGRTDSASFARNLSSFGDVLALLDSLKLAGYIEDSARPTPLSKVPAERAKTKPFIPSSDFTGNGARYAEERRTHFHSRPAYQPASGNTFNWPDDEKSRIEATQLKQAVGLISDFVTEHLSAQALEIVIELERLSSVNVLIQSLSGYEHLVKSVGDPGERHLRQLRTILTGA